MAERTSQDHDAGTTAALLREVVDALAPQLSACETAAANLNARLAAARERLDVVRRACERLERSAAAAQEVRVGQLRGVMGAAHASLLDQGDQVRHLLADLRAAVARDADHGGAASGKPVAGVQDYRRVVERVREAVDAHVPRGATLLVVSRGDLELTRLRGRTAWHFPQAENGLYAGHHPADSDEAIRHLKALRKRGAGYLLIPASSFWWLDHYGDFRKHLETRARRVWGDEHCVIFDVGRRGKATARGGNAKGGSRRSEVA